MVEISAMVGIVMALAQLVKQLDIMSTKYIPLVDLLLGVAMCLVYFKGDIKENIFQGIIVGLTASGLFSSGKNVIRKDEKEGREEEKNEGVAL